jgi:hypothetical protein
MATRTQRADIKIRLTEGLRSKIEKAAKQRGVSMNAEMIERISRTIAKDDAEGDVRQWMADARDVIGKGRDAALRAWGFQPVAGRPGLWIESDKIRPQEMIALNPELEALIERAAERAVELSLVKLVKVAAKRLATEARAKVTAERAVELTGKAMTGRVQGGVAGDYINKLEKTENGK